ncbi:MAG TPA: lipid-A-disaccharide synthase, partial [Chlamydiales bacterium]|nr:lipid-A-disaccharide synthase [Chlamydiales bacterium]
VLTVGAVLTAVLFVAQGILCFDGDTHWLSAPFSSGPLTPPRDVSLTLHLLGSLAVVAFSARFWVQWWKAEISHKSALTRSFWWLSLSGALFSSMYFFAMRDWVNFIGPVIALIPYSRNLSLLAAKEKNQPLDPELAFVFAGEKSADLYGARLLQQLRLQKPHLSVFGVGGKEMEHAGLHLLLPMEKFQVMGFSDVIRSLPSLIWNFFVIKQAIFTRKPALVIFIDQPDFSMHLAKKLRHAGYKGKIVQCVAPSVWAWRKERAEKMAQHFDLLLTLFPFEPLHFSHTNLQTIWTGHPILETITSSDNPTKEYIAIFPGSRPHEVKRNLPIQLQAACKMKTELKIAISQVSYTTRAQINAIIDEVREKYHFENEIIIVPFEERHDLMQRSRVALAKCGTVTLELGLYKVPTVVTYGMSHLNRYIAERAKIQLPYFCIVNILKQKEIFPELIKTQPSSDEVHAALQRLMHNEEVRANVMHELNHLELLLKTEKPPSEIATNAILELIGKS